MQLGDADGQRGFGLGGRSAQVTRAAIVAANVTCIGNVAQASTYVHICAQCAAVLAVGLIPVVSALHRLQAWPEEEESVLGCL